MTKQKPKYLNITEDGVTITLTRPHTFNGVEQDKLTMREPTVRDVRVATKTADYDEEQRELNLFSSLAQVGIGDLEALPVKDYNRVQAGYKFLVRDDEV